MSARVLAVATLALGSMAYSAAPRPVVLGPVPSAVAAVDQGRRPAPLTTNHGTLDAFLVSPTWTTSILTCAASAP